MLGALYNPYYFNKGEAVHGYESVPPVPASHGCSRIPMHIVEYFHTLVNQGDPVYVDGGQPGRDPVEHADQRCGRGTRAGADSRPRCACPDHAAHHPGSRRSTGTRTDTDTG